MMGILDRLLLPVAVLKVAVTRPAELFDRWEARQENKRQSKDPSPPQAGLPVRPDALAAAHEVVGVSACSACSEEIAELESALPTESYKGHFFDAGETLTRILWVIIRHRQPARVVETGVARGVSSAFLLKALELNGKGHLWSIDLPPLTSSAQVEVGSAIPKDVRHRWTLVLGASRRHLPPLLEELETIDVFIHDGLHTPETMTLEFHYAWPYLQSGGVLVADDANANQAFVEFAHRVGRDPVLVVEQGKDSQVGLLQA